MKISRLLSGYSNLEGSTTPKLKTNHLRNPTVNMFLRKEASCGEAICGHPHQLFGMHCSPRRVEFRTGKKLAISHRQASNRAGNKNRSSSPIRNTFNQPSIDNPNLVSTLQVPHKPVKMSSSALHKGKLTII